MSTNSYIHSVKRLGLLLLIVSFWGCANIPKFSHQPPSNLSNTSESNAITNNIPLNQRNPRFLYLAAQAALQNGQSSLAIQFLTAFLEHSETSQADTLNPRIQLAELWLANHQASKSLEILQPLIRAYPIAKHNTDEQKALHTLYARVLASTQKPNDALDYLTRFLSQHPDYLLARHLQISLFIQTQQLELAEIAVNTAIQRHDAAMLRQYQADIFARQNRFEKALQSLKKMQAFDVDDEMPALLQSDLELKRGRTLEAELVLRSFIRTHPAALRVQNALGRLLIQTNRHDEAIIIYTQLTQALPNNAEVFSALGMLYYQQQQFKDAEKQFKRAAKLDPLNTQHRFYHAASLEALKQTELAQSLYKTIEDNSPLWQEAQLRLASIDFTQEHFSAADTHIRNVLKKSPNSAHAWVLLSTSLLAQKKYRQILDETKPATALKDIPSRLQFNRAIAYQHFKQYDDVERTLQPLVSNDVNDVESLNFLAYTYAEQAIKLDIAENYILRALESKPDDGYYLDTLAWVYFKQGKYPQAKQAQGKALKHIKDDPIMTEHYGDILWKLGEAENAIQAWQKALELKAENASVLRQKIKHGL